MKTYTTIKTGTVTEERREFIRKSGAVAAMSLFGLSFFTSCSSDDPEPSPDPDPDPPTSSNGITITNDKVEINLDIQTSLASAGAWLLIPQARLLVFNLGNNQFSSVTSVCTHTGCDRNWTFNNDVLTCTCHNSRFTALGEVLQGPANRDLRSYTNQLSGNLLTINLS